MTDDETVTNNIKHLFCRHKGIQNRTLINEFNNISPCDHGHSDLITAVRRKTLCYGGLAFLVALIFVFLLVLLYFGMEFLKNFNHAYIFGGCSMNIFWPADECPIAF